MYRITFTGLSRWGQRKLVDKDALSELKIMTELSLVQAERQVSALVAAQNASCAGDGGGNCRSVTFKLKLSIVGEDEKMGTTLTIHCEKFSGLMESILDDIRSSAKTIGEEKADEICNRLVQQFADEKDKEEDTAIGPVASDDAHALDGRRERKRAVIRVTIIGVVIGLLCLGIPGIGAFMYMTMTSQISERSEELLATQKMVEEYDQTLSDYAAELEFVQTEVAKVEAERDTYAKENEDLRNKLEELSSLESEIATLRAQIEAQTNSVETEGE